MKLSIGIVVLALAGALSGQNPTVVQKTQIQLAPVTHAKTVAAKVPAKAPVQTAHPVSTKLVKTVAKANTKPAAKAAAVKTAVKANTKPAARPAAVKTAAKTNHKPVVKIAAAKIVTKSNPKQAAKPREAKAVAKVDAKQTAKPAALAKTEAKAQPVSVESEKKSDDDVLKSATKERQISLTGRRDPFLSPVVAQSAGGSGCSTGKRCLAIDEISLKGIVKSENGMIAVVVNALGKAYFLHENDPVFNGYVLHITGDSVVFSETMQDKFGKPFTREVTKRIFTPAV